MSLSAVCRLMLLAGSPFKVHLPNSSVHKHSLIALIMIHFALLVISCLLLVGNARAAFKDFVVDAETEQFESHNELAMGCPAAEEEQPLISFQDVEHDGVVDTQLLLTALLQHAQRLGLNLEQLAAQSQALEEDNLLASDLGCSASEAINYRQQPSWYDVFFN